MRLSRIKAEGHGYYHCLSRVVDRRRIMGDMEREKFRELMRGSERFSGVRVLTYAILSNHFHILVEVPEPQDVDEMEIVSRLSAIYDPEEVFEIKSRWKMWRQQGQEQLVQVELARLRARMYDISEFVKSVKQRFSQWYNRREGRCGTLWEDRFKSVMVEPPAHTARERQDVGALRTMAAYIDLNAVRAGLVTDPKEYRWCGYGEALAGGREAREGLAAIFGDVNEKWRLTAANYRVLLYTAGEEAGQNELGQALRTGISAAKVEEIIKAHGELSLAAVLRCRVRYFSDGVAIGGKAFVEDVFRRHRDNFGPKRKSGARPLRYAAWGGLCSARDLRLTPISAGAG